MNNMEFIQRLSEKMDMPVSDVEPLTQQFVDAFVKEIATGRVVSVQGFGNFESREKAERKMFNPTTRSYSVIPKKVTLNFKMSATLKEKLN